VYPDADSYRKLALKENRGKSGIYKWTNKYTGKSYVGSAVDLTKRLSQYYSQGYLKKELSKGSSAIYRAILKYGCSNFSLSILEYCDKGEIIEREQYYIDHLKPEYNLLPTAGSPLGYKHTEEAKANMRAAHVGRKLSEAQLEHLVKLKAENLGRNHREETKAKQKTSMLKF
jgi:group I intron endonuclease